MPDGRQVREIVARLARGRSIRWDEEERSAASEEDRERIRQLRVVAAMAAFHERIQSDAGEEDLETSISVARSIATGPDPDPLPGSYSGLPVPSASAAFVPGTRWGHLEILEWIGRGSFGEVYRARDTRLDRIVALKTLGEEAPGQKDEAVREARLLAKVRHPHVVTVYGADRIDGRVGIWMEYLSGETLDRLLKQRGVLDAREAALIGIDLCRALSAVHAAGIAHRDVKLANVMRAEGGRIVLMDFGLGHETPRRERKARIRHLSGTPLFMAPEVLIGGREDTRSDVYSLGVVLFALVTGALPVQASTLSDLLARHERREIRRARDLRPDLPESFQHVLDRTLDPDPTSRFQTSGESEKALLASLGAAVLSSPGEIHKRASRWMVPAGLLILLVLAAVTWTLWGRSRGPALVVTQRAPFPEVPDLMIVGEKSGLFGLTVVGVGDVDQDGFDDVLIAAPLLSDSAVEAGKVYLHRGGRNGLEQKPTWTFELPEAGLYLGYALAPLTNMSLDGFPDLVIGGPGSTANNIGKVFVFRGSPNGPSSTPDQVLEGSVGTAFGHSISTGDVNHDGFDDLLVGEPYYSSERSGRALLFMSKGDSFESTPAWTFTGQESSMFGFPVALGGDLNNDGYGDAAIGAPATDFGADGGHRGAAYVFLGSATGLDTIPVILLGRQPAAVFGRAIFFAGDVDADGFQDLCVGSEEASNGEQREGVAEIYFGSAGGVSPYGSVLLESSVMGANFGGHAGPLGDVDGDGCDDVWVGALRYQRTEPRAGAAFIFSGSRERAIRRSWLRVGTRGGTWLGADGCAAGDVNGDGFPDFLVGGPSWDTDAGENTGMVELFLNTRRR